MPLTKVTSGVIAANAVVDSFGTQSITGDKIGLNAITGNTLASNIINSNNIVGGAVTGDKLGATSINANNIVGGTITTTQIASNTISNTNIATGAIENYMRGVNLDFGMRNRIINGAMVIDQRNVGANVVITGTDVSDYVLDRWMVRANSATGSKISVQRATTSATGFSNSQLITSLSAYTIGSTEHFGLLQHIEGLNVFDLAWGTANARPITISFRVRSSLTGTFGGFITNGAGNRWYVFSYTINSANTFEDKSITILGDTSGTWATDNGVGLTLSFSVGAGSSVTGSAGSWGSSLLRSVTGQTSLVGTNGATFYITGVQLEEGSTPTSFEYRPFNTELTLCERYYEKSIALAATPGGGHLAGFVATNTTGNAPNELSGVRFRTRKRTTPSVTIYHAVNGTSGAVYRVSDGASVNVSAINHIGETGIGFLALASSSENGYYWQFVASIEL